MSEENVRTNAINDKKRGLLEDDRENMNPKKPRAEESKEEEEVEMSQRKGVQRYLVAVEYIGTNFAGFQKQPNCRTVQGALEDAFNKFVGQPVSSAGSSRTDAGVHALSNVCHVDVERISKRKPGEVLPPHEPGVVKRAVNHFLQKDAGDMMVVDVRCVPLNFHARFRAQERTYYYRILSGKEPLPIFEKERAWHIIEDLDISAMQEACKVLIGYHDFSSFRSTGCQAKSPIKTLDELHICEMPACPAFPPSMDRQNKVNTKENNCPDLSCEGEVSFENIVEMEEKKIISQGNSVKPEKPEMICQSDYECSDQGEVLEFGRRRLHRCYVVTARARSFLYHQVRLLVGVLKCAGTGTLTIDDVERILKARTVTAAPPMAPSCGLYLAEVKYDFSSSIVNRMDEDDD